MEALKDGEDLQVPENIDIPVDPDSQAEVEPNFVDLEASEPGTPAETEATTDQPEGEGEAVNNTPEATQGPQQPESPEAEPSSLQSEQPKEPVSQPEPELSQEAVMDFLSKQLGKEIKSLEDLTPEPPDPFNGDEDLKAIAEWREKTGRPLSDWAKYQRDYSAMSDEEAAREYLQHRYPDFTADEIQLELEQYLPSEDDLDNESARKRLNLKKLAADGRRDLNELRLELGNPAPNRLTQEQQEAVTYYESVKQQQAKAQEVAKLNDQNLNKAIESTDILPLQLDKDVNIEFKPPQENRKSLRDFMKMPNWYNPDGTLNAQEVVKDSYKLQNFETIVQEAYKQGLAQSKASIDKEINNKTLDEPRRTADSGTLGEGNDIIIEGLEDMQKPKLQWR